MFELPSLSLRHARSPALRTYEHNQSSVRFQADQQPFVVTTDVANPAQVENNIVFNLQPTEAQQAEFQDLLERAAEEAGAAAVVTSAASPTLAEQQQQILNIKKEADGEFFYLTYYKEVLYYIYYKAICSLCSRRNHVQLDWLRSGRTPIGAVVVSEPGHASHSLRPDQQDCLRQDYRGAGRK